LVDGGKSSKIVTHKGGFGGEREKKHSWFWEKVCERKRGEMKKNRRERGGLDQSEREEKKNGRERGERTKCNKIGFFGSDSFALRSG